MSRISIIGALSMAIVVVLSNILVQFLFGNWLTWGAFTYPLAFLVTDLLNRLEGPAQARKVVLVGFVIGVICSLIGSQIMGEFGPLVTLRIAIGSGTAFLIAQLLDISLFQKLRERAWWVPPLVSSMLSSALDTLIFFSIAFSTFFIFLEPANDVSWANEMLPLLGFGFVAPLWVSLAVADYLVKTLVAWLALIPYRSVLGRKNLLKA